ncbi:hypothetical protein [Indioceanicola profundi]|uniref:hypothetical protein n=1 Tax=Indioceanicola profundi TaxID=2220096 RepID=UPI000E6AC948|nr:hypothetical protein [Indioceanicola profundi]
MQPVIINPRGTAGAGKTHFVRRLLAAYGWTGEAAPPQAVPVMRAGRRRPIAWHLAHPAGGRPLAVLGHYGEATCGGCDTIRAVDGGLAEAFRLARRFAAEGHDVLLEGLVLSAEVEHTSELAREHPLHVIRLDTPPEDCLRRLLARRRSGPAARTRLAEKLERERRRLERACAELSPPVRLEILRFDAALGRAHSLLELH